MIGQFIWILGLFSSFSSFSIQDLVSEKISQYMDMNSNSAINFVTRFQASRPLVQALGFQHWLWAFGQIFRKVKLLVWPHIQSKLSIGSIGSRMCFTINFTMLLFSQCSICVLGLKQVCGFIGTGMFMKVNLRPFELIN